MGRINIELPLTKDKVSKLKIGDIALLSGVLYTGRDAAHKKMMEALDRGEQLPFQVSDSTIYYVGPSPAKPGMVIGSAGPTTSYRMDSYAPRLISLGMRGMIGKGKRNEEVLSAMKKYGAVYFGATGGAAALLAQRIISAKVIAYDELGPEAVRELTVEDFPVIVVCDSHGGDLYSEGRKIYEIK